jgi:predicted XRE-type DNA-binding protein
MTAKTTKHTKPPVSITESSGNVFADLGLPNPEQEMMKARLTLQIYRIIRERGLTQAQAAKVLGIKQPHVRVTADARPLGQFLGRPSHGISDGTRPGTWRSLCGLPGRHTATCP